MKKENFEYIDEKYVLESDEVLLTISEDIFDDETIEYANSVVEKYKKEKDSILDYMLERRLRDFYGEDHDDEFIKNNLGRPQINIEQKKDGAHPDWNFEYFGSIEFLESNLDEHIITIEFADALRLSKNVQIDG